MADDGLNRCTASHLAADRGRDPADLAGDPDPEPVGVAMAAITLVDVDAAGLDAGELLQIGDDGTEGMAVIRASVQRLQPDARSWRWRCRGRDEGRAPLASAGQMAPKM